MKSGTPARHRWPPVVSRDCPQRLVETLAAMLERVSEDGLANGSQLEEGAVATSVEKGGPGLEALYPHVTQREVDEASRAGHKEPGAPVGGAKSKPPFGNRAVRVDDT